MNPRGPQPAIKRPPCPAYLDDVARRQWRRLAPILERMRVLTEAEEIALGSLCVQYAMLIKAQRLLDKSGLLFVAGCVEQVGKLCREFGLTPGSRTRIQTAPEDPHSSMDRIMGMMLRDDPSDSRQPRPAEAPRGNWVSQAAAGGWQNQQQQSP